MDRAIAEKLLKDVQAAIDLGEIEGFSIKLLPGTYDPRGTITFKVEASELSADGTVNTPERIAWKGARFIGGVETEWLDQTFTHEHKVYTIVGLKPRSYVRPILCEGPDGRMAKFPVNMVRAAMGLSKFVDPVEAAGDWRR